MASRTLLCWDFDWSLIEENTDTWVLQQLGADAFYRAGRQAGTQWTRLMDECLEKAASQLGRTPADVQAALHATPFHPELVALLRRVAATSGGGGSSSCGGSDSNGNGSGSSAIDVAVISDANTVYIETILTHHGLSPAVLEVHSNPAEWRGGALRVAPYHTAPHGCRHCPSNLCKGQVLASLLQRQAAAGLRYDRVLYVGDGKGDYCPSALLLHGSQHWHAAGGAAIAAGCAASSNPATNGAAATAAQRGDSNAPAPAPCGSGSNRVFARESYPDGLPCSLWVMLRTEAAGNSGSGSGGSSAGGGSSSTPTSGQAAAAAAGGEAAAAGHAAGRQARVVPWSQPEELAGLLLKELQLS
ncbi:inorganic pyrophosphatase 3 [Chlorella sorokiniana]|uniref:Inorganic pyrophosphatase 3 n=1 Tax=Chlorella sorokiniana TaxID=3076 RepID=A0A2P6TF79_CHLSO|nr:inorganic pyrophosphatase 3 [Chlorella sorokiniana]|eukprot:PRW32627.1 inorganic pyrophosphatase 3 [Chlorella sorokiniana]